MINKITSQNPNIIAVHTNNYSQKLYGVVSGLELKTI